MNADDALFIYEILLSRLLLASFHQQEGPDGSFGFDHRTVVS